MKLAIITATLTTLTLVACAPKPATANGAVNRSMWETSSGTRNVSGSSYSKGDTLSIKNSQVLKLDGTGEGAKGDVYFRNGQLSGGYWSLGGADDKTPGFVAGYAASETSITNEWFGSNTNFNSHERFNASSDSFYVGD